MSWVNSFSPNSIDALSVFVALILILRRAVRSSKDEVRRRGSGRVEVGGRGSHGRPWGVRSAFGARISRQDVQVISATASTLHNPIEITLSGTYFASKYSKYRIFKVLKPFTLLSESNVRIGCLVSANYWDYMGLGHECISAAAAQHSTAQLRLTYPRKTVESKKVEEISAIECNDKLIRDCI